MRNNEELRKELDSQVQEFLAKGKKIKVLPEAATAFPEKAQTSYHERVRKLIQRR